MGALLAEALALIGRHLERADRLEMGGGGVEAAPALTVVPVNVTGGDCQEMLKLELLPGVKLAQAEPLLVLLEGMETGAVAWRQSSSLVPEQGGGHARHNHGVMVTMQTFITNSIPACSCC